MWQKVKSWFGSDAPARAVAPKPGPASTSTLPDVRWLPEEENRWGVQVLDVRPMTQGMLSTSRDPQCATNAISFLQDDGLSFVTVKPSVARVTDTNLSFPSSGLFDGALFLPRVMEEKWAIYYHANHILFIRSWTRTLLVRAEIQVADGDVRIGRTEGAFTDENEAPRFTARVLEYLLRSHALEEVYPAPLVSHPDDLRLAARWCFSMFGRRAFLASAEEIPSTTPTKPLRTDSLLHIAVARGDTEAAAAQLKAGVPLGLIARDGLPVLHWALASKKADMVSWILDHEGDVDVRSDEGATALMTAVQRKNLQHVASLVTRGADVNARDTRGFTALHRAAEMGHEELVRVLLTSGADRGIEAEGNTPLSLATLRENKAIVDLLK